MPPKTKAPARSMKTLREQMTNRYGDGRVTRRETVKSYEVVSTGSLSLDLATGVGGLVRGRLHEIVGAEGVGKTTTMIQAMANAQRAYPDLAVGIIDMEQTFDFDWAEKNGLDTSDERFLHVYPDDAEDVSDQLNAMASTGLFSMLVVDSIGGMESRVAFDKDAAERVMGNNAQVITRMVKRCAVLFQRHNVAGVLVNQYRANLSNPAGRDISAGPKAMKYSTTMKIEMSAAMGDDFPLLKVKMPGEDEALVVGRAVRARVTRNKVAPQGRTAEYYIVNVETTDFGPIGIDVADEALTIGLKTGVVKQEPGGYYRLPSTKTDKDRIRGRLSVLAYLRENRDEALLIRDKAVETVAHEVKADLDVEFDPKTGELVEA